MGDDDRRAPRRELGQRRLHRGLGLVVERGGRLVEDQDRRVLEEDARDGDALLLATGKPCAPLPHLGLVAFGQVADELVHTGAPGRFADLGGGGVGQTIGDVVGDRPVEEVDVLLHEANRLAQGLLGDLAHVLTVDRDGARVHVVEARQKRAGRGLAAARGAHERQRLARADVEREAVEHALALHVGEVHVAVADGPFAHLQVRRARRVLDIGLGLEHLHKALEARDRLLEHLREVQDARDRRGEKRGIEGEGREVGRLHPATRDKPAAHHDDRHVEAAHHDRDQRLVDAHGPVHMDLGVEVGLIGPAELGTLEVLGGEGFHHTHALQRVLQARIHARDGHAVLVVDGPHAKVGHDVQRDERR